MTAEVAARWGSYAPGLFFAAGSMVLATLLLAVLKVTSSAQERQLSRGECAAELDGTMRYALFRAGVVECLRLQDGRGVNIRPIVPADLDALRAFFAALTPATRRLRFHVQVHQISADVLVKLSLVDQSSHVAFIAEPCGSAHPGLIGEARYIRGPEAECAELALVVAEAWRQVGLGSALTRALLRSARAAGVRRLCGDALAENVAIVRLLHLFGARRLPTPDPEIVRLCVEA